MLETLADLDVLDGVVLVTGRPSAGKTTLARALAECTAGKHVSVGDQLRLLRTSSTWTDVDAQAYNGHRPFPLATLTEALSRGIGPAPSRTLVVDGSVGLREAVIAVTGRPPIVELQLTLDDAVAMNRLAARAISGQRPCDTAAIARRRAVLWRAYNDGSAPRWPVIALDANATAPALVGRALRSLLVIGTADATEQLARVNPIAGQPLGRRLIELADRARSTAQPHAAEINPTAADRTGILLIKPGLGQSAATFERFAEWIQHAGYHISAATAWPLTARDVARRIAVHHGDHYVNCRWGDHVVDPIAGDPRPVVGYLQTRPSPAEWLSDMMIRTREPRGPSLWIDVDGDRAVVNSHVPGVISVWFSVPTDVILALAVDGPDWAMQADRSAALGVPDPAQASRHSLRGAAHTGQIPFDRPPTLQNNGFHASDSPATAQHERRIWFADRA
ncbi:nucleoside-diphosphate kinase [Mycobacterium riyadhense]|uniref:Uncharacterized protein n=1 Tax=Mycobacterium riyadhense TaxID=486698 RepID=A0A1X2CV50_9MYCO|nr:nucleoside-diphosphate kinase [Mycobacterium riyadhense]MCV7147010.1 hypothetical protein [Mycobacterium riyadhense]ORW79748.1 hypothetical protein AWC22_18585 [Mycobacterium riyadhense]VTP00410.1 hypothetical protein BIN_B_03512 [Mycobacterium riyadhense]